MTLLKSVLPKLIAGLLPLFLPTIGQVASAYQKITIAGETSSHGVYDCSIEYASDSVTGYMAYSACDNWPERIHTHLAKTSDHGLTWTYVQAINVSSADTITIGGAPISGTWHHEVPALVHDPDDPGKEWKLYWHRYFARSPYNPSTDSLWGYGWIAYRYASNPEGAWSTEIPLFGAGPYPPAPYTVQINLNAGNPALVNMLAYTEPGGLYVNGTLYLALQGNTANQNEQMIFLLKSADHGVHWTFADVLANSQTAHGLGYDFLSAPSLVAEAQRQFIFMSPGRLTLPDHDGTLIVEFVDLSAARLQKDVNQALVVYKSLAPCLSTINAGESDYDASNYNGGMVMPQLQLTPCIEFQLWNTFEPLLPTPIANMTPFPTPTPRAAENAFKVAAYPNPGQSRINFKITGESSAKAEVVIEIYNMAGECIACLDQFLGQDGVITWEREKAAPGIYLACVTINGRQKTKLKIAVIDK